MKHKYFLSSFVIAGSLFSSSSLMAVDISVGASAWYVSWERTTLAGNGKSEIKQNMGPDLMYGPLVAVKFAEAWSLSSVFLYNSSPFILRTQGSIETKYNRLDSDTLLNYNFNRFIKAFAGVKYEDISWNNAVSKGGNFGIGPGLGLGATIPIAGNLYFLTNISGMYLTGKFKNETKSGDMGRYGYNVNANLAYYIEQISLTITGGYRYQFYRTDFSKDQNSNENIFSGATLSVIYNF